MSNVMEAVAFVTVHVIVALASGMRSPAGVVSTGTPVPVRHCQMPVWT